MLEKNKSLGFLVMAGVAALASLFMVFKGGFVDMIFGLALAGGLFLVFKKSNFKYRQANYESLNKFSDDLKAFVEKSTLLNKISGFYMVWVGLALAFTVLGRFLSAIPSTLTAIILSVTLFLIVLSLIKLVAEKKYKQSATGLLLYSVTKIVTVLLSIGSGLKVGAVVDFVFFWNLYCYLTTYANGEQQETDEEPCNEINIKLPKLAGKLPAFGKKKNANTEEAGIDTPKTEAASTETEAAAEVLEEVKTE